MADDNSDYNDYDANKWSNLLPELLHLIAFEFDNHKDLLTFRSVCKSWRSLAMADARLTPFPPLFLIPYDKSNDLRYYYDPTNQLSYSESTVAIPESVGKLIIGTAHGFLILLSSTENTTEYCDVSVSLFNPITRSHIHLPILHPHRRCKGYLCALLSSHPRSEPPPVLALWGYDKLFFLTLGDDYWTWSHCTDPYYSDCREFAYCHGSFFLSTYSDAKIKVIDAQSLESSELEVPLEEHMKCDSYHMMLFSGDLFLVVSNYDEPKPDFYKAYAAFKLVKENIEQSQSRWRWLKEDYSRNECVTRGSAFFLSDYLSVAVASPDLIACKANYIYNGFRHINEAYKCFRKETAYAVCIAEFNLPFITSSDLDDYWENDVDDEIWWVSDYSDEDEDYWLVDNGSSMKKVHHRRYKEGVCSWFIPDPH